MSDLNDQYLRALDICRELNGEKAEQDKRIQQLETECNNRLGDRLRLEERIQQLVDALHEIYGRACVAMGEDDDLVLYQFAQEARDIALRAAKEKIDG